MENIKTANLSEQVQKNVEPFLLDILNHCKEDVISIYVIGSAVTKDFHPKDSDINTLLVVKEIKVPLFDFIATLSKRYGKKRVRAPLIMTRDYIDRSLEVFPLEFLEMKLIHQLVYGEDVLKNISIGKADARLQCERELKGKLQHICQGYIKAMGNKSALTDMFVGSLSGYFPEFHGILFLFDQKLPKEKGAVLSAVENLFDIDLGVYKKLLEIKSQIGWFSFYRLRPRSWALFAVTCSKPLHRRAAVTCLPVEIAAACLGPSEDNSLAMSLAHAT